MPDAARIAQAQALEIPVTIQGAKSVDGTGRRELFAEAAKTTLIFDDGMVLNLRTRLTAGQSVFVRNDQTGQEVLCKVLEAPPEGEPGYTDLEFMETAPGFWEGEPEAPQAATEEPEAVSQKSETRTAAEPPQPAATKPEGETAAEKPEPAAAKSEAEPAASTELTAAPDPAAEKPAAPAHEGTEAAAENSLAMMSATASEVKLPPAQVSDLDPPLPPAKAPQEEIPRPRREELVPAHEMVPETPPAPAATEPTGEQIDAAVRTMAAVPGDTHDDADSSGADDKANLAALMARDAKLAKYAALKAKVAAIGRGPASRDASKGAEATANAAGAENAEGPQGAGDAIVEEVGPPPVPLMERLTTGKNLIVSEIVVAVAIVVAFFFIWHAVSPLFMHRGEPRLATAAPARKVTLPKAPPPVVVQAPAAPVAKVPAARPAVVVRPPVAPVAKIDRRPEAPRQSPPETAEEDGPRVVEPEPSNEPPEDVARAKPKADENIPAKILTESQPPLPPWAKTLDIGTVVRLDAVIDENGNLGEMKIVSGPRLLERAAEQAVQIWLFEPAQLDGKPTATHMILTVEFQR